MQKKLTFRLTNSLDFDIRPQKYILNDYLLSVVYSPTNNMSVKVVLLWMSRDTETQLA